MHVDQETQKLYQFLTHQKTYSTNSDYSLASWQTNAKLALRTQLQFPKKHYSFSFHPQLNNEKHYKLVLHVFRNIVCM